MPKTDLLTCLYASEKHKYITRTDRILVLVCVNACVDNVAKEIIQNVAQPFGIEHSVQCTDEHGLLWVQTLRRLLDVVTVTEYPWDHLYLETDMYPWIMTTKI